ncbi:uncharacterized protein G6M90_00g111290 [Metarhizium brunneum]|uniref:CoA-binding domain-containing protein n=1 Tax=Metarhizium brunneum TaxID=500148 RepID=A0A7D5Z6F4_9HYPO|nr:hypothetical protein G6M90_00g111290 [Metarhizium brunneum]
MAGFFIAEAVGATCNSRFPSSAVALNSQPQHSEGHARRTGTGTMLSRSSLRLGKHHAIARTFCTSHRRLADYDSTIDSLRHINSNTRVIYQGESRGSLYEHEANATSNAKDTIGYGTKVVGGVSPGKGGQTHLDLPVFGTVKEVLNSQHTNSLANKQTRAFIDQPQAMEQVDPHVSAVFVPAPFAARAIIEAIEAEVPVIVSVAEHIPVHDLLRVQEVLRTQSRSRLVGPNCPGVIAPGQCRVGIMPFRQYARGCVGIVSKSGTLSYEAVGATTAAGLGQSLVVAVGGDPMPGTTIVDSLRVLFEHEETEGVIVIGEIGGEQELRAAEMIREYRRSTPNPKPVVAMVAGQTAPRGKVMGHAGAVLKPGDVTAAEKARALEDAGAVLVPHPGVMGSTMKALLGR